MRRLFTSTAVLMGARTVIASSRESSWRGAQADRAASWWLRTILVVSLMVFVGSFVGAAKAADHCRPATRGPSWAEWFEDEKPRGARFVFERAWEEVGTPHGQWLAYQPYPRDAPIGGWLWLGVGLLSEEPLTAPILTSRLAALLQPHTIEQSIGAATGLHPDSDLYAVSEPEPQRVAALVGLSRIVAAKFDGRVLHAAAFAAEDGCLLIYGLFSAKDGHRLSNEELSFLSSSLRLERYDPKPPERLPPPKRAVTFEEFRLSLGLD